MTKVTQSGPIRRVLNILRRGLAFLVVLVLLLFSILSIPAVQTYLGKKVTNSLNEEYGTQIFIDRIGLKWNGAVTAKGIYIQDYRNDTLAYIGELRTSLLSVQNAANGKLEFGTLSLEKVTFKMVTYPGEDETNLDVFISKLDKYDSLPDTSPASFFMSAKQISLYDSKFRLTDMNREQPEILNFQNLQASLRDFLIQGPTVSMKIGGLSFLDSSYLLVEKLSCNFRYTREQMTLDDLSIQTEGSFIKGKIRFDYQREDFAQFFDKVKLHASFTDSEISFSDLNHFYPQFGNQVAGIFSTELEGTLNALTAKNFRYKSRSTSIRAVLNLQNVFSVTEPFQLTSNFSLLQTNYYELVEFMPKLLGKSLPNRLIKLGTFKAVGQTDVMENKISVYMDLETDLGLARTTLDLSDMDKVDEVTYEGGVQLTDFELGALLDIETLELVTCDVEVSGKSFNQATLNTQVEGVISKISYNNYEYKSINLNGKFKDERFEGRLNSRDPNLDFSFSGLVDFSTDNRKFKFKADLAHVDLYKTHFIQRDSISILKGQVEMDMQGNSFDNASGVIQFINASYTNQRDVYRFEDFRITSTFQNEVRTITINSPDIITGKIHGRFRFSEVPTIVKNALGGIYSNYKPDKVSPNQYADFDFDIYNKIVDLFFPEVKFGPNTRVDGSFDTRDSSFALTFRSPSLEAFGSEEIKNIYLVMDNKNPLYNTYLEVGGIDTSLYTITDLSLINTTVKDTLFFRTEFKGGALKQDLYFLNFYHTIDPGGRSVVGLKKSNILFKDNEWIINSQGDKHNKVVFGASKDSLLVDKIQISHFDERITLDGHMLGEREKNLQLEFEHLELQKILPDIDSLRLDGILDGKLDILQQKGNYLPSANLSITDLAVNDRTYGKFNAIMKGNKDLSEYEVNLDLAYNNIKYLMAAGSIKVPEVGSPQVYLDTSLDRLDISSLSALGEDVISDIRGKVSGNFIVQGVLTDPSINGTLRLTNSGLRIPYLNIDFDLESPSQIELNDHSFRFEQIGLIDTKFKTNALLTGSISHKEFKTWSLDLNLESDRVVVLDTEKDNDEPYYGRAYMDGNASLRGPVNQISIEVQAITAAGTDLKIPIDYIKSVEDNKFITFIDKTEGYKKQDQDKAINYSGVELAFDLDINPQASIEIIIDEKTKSSIKGRGYGTLLLEISTDGKFNMWGDFITLDGSYNYKLGGIINKIFKVKPGGNIAWEGDPFNAQLNLAAVYEVPGGANPIVLLDNPNYTRKIPTNVEILLTGSLSSVEPSFEITFPSQGRIVESELRYRLQDQESKKTQALSLLLRGSFINQGSLTDNAVRNNALESLFGNVNAFFNDPDEKINLSFNMSASQYYQEYDVQTDDFLNVKADVQISDRILFNGQLGVPVGGVNQNTIVGNVQFDFLLNEKGTVRTRVFNRENEQQFIGEEIGYTQGVGISYEVDFDSFRELKDRIFNSDNKEIKSSEEKDSIGMEENNGINFKPKNNRR